VFERIPFSHVAVILGLSAILAQTAWAPADSTVYYDTEDKDLKTLQFGVGDLVQALSDAGQPATVRDLSGSPSSGFIFTLDKKAGTEAYTLTIDGTCIKCDGGRIGLMYGALELAENVRNGTLKLVKSGERKPYLEKRGLKINIPLDARTPSYADFGTAAQENIPEMWSMDFWKAQLDAMARNRYNCYTLWNLHPFPSLVKVKDYPDVALDDVKRFKLELAEKNRSYDTKGLDSVDEEILGSLETVKKISIDGKIKFWRDVMQHGHDRGIEFHVYTWNLFLWGAAGKHSLITNEKLCDYRKNWSSFKKSSDYVKIIDYFQNSTRALFETYPLLAGIGVTGGEGMGSGKGEASDEDKEDFLFDAYGKPVLDVVKADSKRHVVFVHRSHQVDTDEVNKKFGDLVAHPRITFDYSTKYVNARLYSFAGEGQGKKDVSLDKLPKGGKWWLNLRNDDIYNFRWGNHEFVQTFIKWLSREEKERDGDPLPSIRGIHMGPDGSVFGRECTDKRPSSPRQLEHDKHWLRYMLWGRLAYDPETPESIFQKEAARRLGIKDPASLMEAWKRASLIIPVVNRNHYYPGDYQYHAEYNHDRRPFKWHGVRIWASMVKDDGDDVAGELDGHADYVLKKLPGLRKASGGTEYEKTLDDLECFAHLGAFYADYARAGHDLYLACKNEDKFSYKKPDYSLPRIDKAALNKARAHAEDAAAHWKEYAETASRLYRDQVLARVQPLEWKALHREILDEIDDMK
jgi:hypothetical protein